MKKIPKTFKKNYIGKFVILFLVLLTGIFFAISHNNAFNKDFFSEVDQAKRHETFV